MGLLSFILDLLRQSALGAGTPTRQSGAPATGASAPQPTPGQMIERAVERQLIPGMSVGFGVAEEAWLGANGALDRQRNVAGLVGGDGHLISDYEHLGGLCPFCQAEAQELLARGEIDLPTAQSRGLYCKDCRATCSSCNQGTCKRHAVQLQQEDGSVISLCPPCAEAYEKSQLVKRVLGIVLGPFVFIPSSEQGKENPNGTR